VLYLGARVQSLPTPAFMAAMVLLIAVLALAAMTIERYVNQLTQRALGKRSEPAQKIN
jgi:hypothetical protein